MATLLQGVYTGSEDPFAKFRELKPACCVGNSLLIYNSDDPGFSETGTFSTRCCL